MGVIVFIPGMLGSELTLDGERLWPPTLVEAVMGYRRLDALLDDRVEAGAPIAAVACLRVYGPLLDDLAEIAGGRAGAPARRLLAFGYDWRRDLRETALRLAEQIEALSPEEADDIALVGHSMGGLVARLILESPVFHTRPWRARIRTHVALAVPDLGAPIALVRALGLEGTSGLSGRAVRRLGGDPRYPALLQLLPAPGITALWRTTAGRPPEPLDLHAAAVCEALGLGDLAPARALHAALDRRARPIGLRSLSLAGSGETTCLRLDLSGAGPVPRFGRAAGDGTVPLWSALDPTVAHHVAPGEHAGLFRNDELRGPLFAALGARLPVRPFAAGTAPPSLRLTASAPVVPFGRPVDLTLHPDAGTARIIGDLVVEGATPTPAARFAPRLRQPVAWTGGVHMPLRSRLASDLAPGVYRVGFDGEPALSEGGEAVFAVAAPIDEAAP